MAQRLTIGELLLFLAYLAPLYEPLNQLSHLRATWSDARVGTQRVFELLDTPEEIKEAPDARRLKQSAKEAGEIEFDRVSFSYEKDRLVLRDLQFSVASGESVAIIGPSGSGKTTLLQLLPRFYDPTSGAIKLDGVVKSNALIWREHFWKMRRSSCSMSRPAPWTRKAKRWSWRAWAS